MARSQSALEYLMTYGWAILIIVIVAGVLYSFGVFSLSAAVSLSVSGFSGFQVTALCTPAGVLVIRLGNAIGNTINVTYVNSTFGGKQSFSGVNYVITPDNSYDVFLSNGCSNQSDSRFSSSITVTYTEPGSVFPGPYFSSGTISGSTSSFTQNSVANLTNASYINIPSSSTMDLFWGSANQVSFVFWADCVKVYPGCYFDACITFISENEGCTEGASGGTVNSTYFSAGVSEWNGSTAYQCKATGGYGSPNYPVPYNKWSLIVDEYTYNPSSDQITFTVCIDDICNNNTEGIPGGPGFYLTPTTLIMNEHNNGKLANLQFYDTYLSQKQVSDLYGEGYAGLPVTAKGLLAWLPLDGNANDYSGNGNNGQATGVTFVSP